MSIHRRASQKPTSDLLSNFKANFPRFTPNALGGSASVEDGSLAADALGGAVNARTVDHQAQDNNKDAVSATTSRPPNDLWNFGTSGLTPSIMDPNSHHFNMFANQIPGYYTPTPGGTNTIYHHTNAGDLHTPGFTMGMETPLSLPTSAGAMQAGHPFGGFVPFGHHMPSMEQHNFQNPDPFVMHGQQQAFPPHHFTHQPSFDHMEGPIGESPVDNLNMHIAAQEQHQSPQMMYPPQALPQAPAQHPPLRGSEENFRYYVTLNAPTAMIRHSDEIPITYLNKGQAYTLNVHDMHCQQPATPARYRTFVRISFEDEQQRQKPAQCWQLWKEGRGTNEAHQRGGRLQAVEYVESGQMAGAEDPSKPRVQLEYASFDGFCVVWSPSPGRADCPISVRFNFLSTDFSHSKGVKGIPVRLCSKTEMLQDTPTPGSAQDSEVCFCKVKLFRDHGAERKLSNDVAHIRKTIEKIDQQIEQMRNGLRDPANRKKKGGVARPPPPPMEGPGKAPKHSRTWSVNSVTSLSGRGSAEDELLTKKATLHDMFNSTHNSSVLHLRGTPEDDPDLYPVKLSSDSVTLPRQDSGETSGIKWDRQSTQDGPPSTAVSPTASSQDLDVARRASLAQNIGSLRGPARTDSDEWRAQPQTATTDLQTRSAQESPAMSGPRAVQRRSTQPDSKAGLIEVIGIDDSYVPPRERVVKPVACYYVQPRVSNRDTGHLYRAVYITRHSIKDFERAVATKCDIEPTSVLRTLRIMDGRGVLFDDECIVELPEGQDMVAEFAEVELDTPARSLRDWESGPAEVQCDGDILTTQNVSTSGYELRLHY